MSITAVIFPILYLFNNFTHVYNVIYIYTHICVGMYIYAPVMPLPCSPLAHLLPQWSPSHLHTLSFCSSPVQEAKATFFMIAITAYPENNISKQSSLSSGSYNHFSLSPESLGTLNRVESGWRCVVQGWVLSGHCSGTLTS